MCPKSFRTAGNFGHFGQRSPAGECPRSFRTHGDFGHFGHETPTREAVTRSPFPVPVPFPAVPGKRGDVNFADVLDALGAIPALPGAACRGTTPLFDDTGDNTAALALCRRCAARIPCREWFDTLAPRERPEGVVAGLLHHRDSKRRRSTITHPPEQENTVMAINRDKKLRDSAIAEIEGDNGIVVTPDCVVVGSGYDAETGADVVYIGGLDAERRKNLLTLTVSLETAREARDLLTERIAELDHINAANTSTNREENGNA